MIEVYLKSGIYPQPVTLSDGSSGYLDRQRHLNQNRYVFHFVDHFDHNFWLNEQPADGMTINVNSVDGLTRYKLLCDW